MVNQSMLSQPGCPDNVEDAGEPPAPDIIIDEGEDGYMVINIPPPRRPPNPGYEVIGYELISDPDINAYYAEVGQPRPSKEAWNHETWLGRLESGKNGPFLVIEISPLRYIRRIPVSQIPTSSKVLLELRDKPLFTRHIWLKEIHTDYFDNYLIQANPFGAKTKEALAAVRSEEVVGIAITASKLEDALVLGMSLAALRLKAERGWQCPKYIIELAYNCTLPGSLIRSLLIDMTIEHEGFVEYLEGPTPFLADVTVAMNRLSIVGRTPANAMRGARPAGAKEEELPMFISGTVMQAKLKKPVAGSVEDKEAMDHVLRGRSVEAAASRPRHLLPPLSNPARGVNRGGVEKHRGIHAGSVGSAGVDNLLDRTEGMAMRQEYKAAVKAARKWAPIRQPRVPVDVEELKASKGDNFKRGGDGLKDLPGRFDQGEKKEFR